MPQGCVLSPLLFKIIFIVVFQVAIEDIETGKFRVTLQWYISCHFVTYDVTLSILLKTDNFLVQPTSISKTRWFRVVDFNRTLIWKLEPMKRVYLYIELSWRFLSLYSRLFDDESPNKKVNNKSEFLRHTKSYYNKENPEENGYDGPRICEHKVVMIYGISDLSRLKTSQKFRK